MQEISYDHGKAYTDGVVVKFYIGTKARPDLWATVDAIDWPLIRDRKWHGRPRGRGMYVYHKASGYLHRVLIITPEGMVIDHVDGDPTNNRRSNLRVCTQADNMRYGADRRRGFSLIKIEGTKPTKKHVVRVKKADGTVKEYVYPTRSKKGTLRKQTVKRGQDYKMAVEE